MSNELNDSISIELTNMSVVVSETIKLLSRIGDSDADIVQKTALAGFASQFYNGVENILKRVHKQKQIPLPTGDNWHIVLLKRFSIDSQYEMPFKFDEKMFEELSDLRRFRHYFFHGYSINIDWQVLKESISELDTLFNSLKKLII